MKVIKYIFIGGAALVLVFVIAGYFYTQGLKPTYSGEQQITGLSEDTEVIYDEFGIPHIYASSNEDAYRALGYVHAQDRLWQMELMRRIASGRLSEMFGKDLLDTDKFFKILGIHRASKKEAEKFRSIDAEIQSYVNAYLEGINTFIDEGPEPIEFLMLGIGKEHYTVEDIHNVIGYIAFSFAQAQKSDPVVTKIASVLGEKYLRDLDINESFTKEQIRNYPASSILDSLYGKSNEILTNLPAPQWLGSNSWVISPDKSATGAVILANDPHMGFSQPCVWYEAHIKTPTFERYGYHAAMVPFALLLHNRTYATGLTMFENDDVDFYKNVEILDSFEETINIKDEESVTVKIDVSSHGPIMNGAIEMLGSEPIAMWWTFLQQPMESIEALYGINHADGIDDVRDAASKIGAPGLNVMYGDKDGNYAWWASAKLHLLSGNANPNMILDAKKDTISEWLPFSENPQAENTPWKYVYSTNNQPAKIKGGLYPGYYAPDNRALRITSLLNENNSISVEDHQKFFLDKKAPSFEKLAKELSKLIKPESNSEAEQEALAILEIWNGEHTKESAAPVIFYKFIYHVGRLAMDELPVDDFDAFFNTHLMKRSISKLYLNNYSPWWDNAETKDRETRSDIVNEAFRITVDELSEQLGDVDDWEWSDVHTLEHPHPIGKVEALSSFFNVGSFNMEAGDEVLNKLSFVRNGSGLYPITSGPSTRRLVNFADIENSLSILPTGQSGNPFSEHYDDQADLYIKGKWRKMMMNEEEIRSKAKNKLVLKP